MTTQLPLAGSGGAAAGGSGASSPAGNAAAALITQSHPPASPAGVGPTLVASPRSNQRRAIL